MFEDLCFDLINHGVKEELPTAFIGVFECYAHIVNPDWGGEKMYALTLIVS